MLLFIWMQGLPTAFPVSFQYISCYCLSGWFAHRNLWRHISIHLMLLFIPPIMLSKSIRPVFQYISCYCLSMSLSFVTLDFANFNTSHVTVYPCTYRNHIVYNTISIHLMLLFIPIPAVNPTNQSNFNTSHVTVYRGATITRTQSGKYFNTSHVTVYRIPDTDEAFEMVFQYISCYCLSNSIQPLKSLFVKFQYISCYCLSDLQIFLLHCLRNFNTSHVTVYRFPPGFTISVNRYFNTSHVTVYPIRYRWGICV